MVDIKDFYIDENLSIMEKTGSFLEQVKNRIAVEWMRLW